MYSGLMKYFNGLRDKKTYLIEISNKENIAIQITRVGTVLKDIQSIMEREDDDDLYVI